MSTSSDVRSPSQIGFPPEEFAARRAKALDAIGGEALALVQGAPAVRGFEVFRQSNEFHYLCGVEVPHSYLLLDGRSRKATLFLPDPLLIQASSEGDSLAGQAPEAVVKLTGVDEVRRADALSGMLKGARTLYVPHSPAEGRAVSRDEALRGNRIAASDPWDGEIPREARFIGLLRARHPSVEIRDLSPILDRLRMLKTPREMELLRRAGRLTGLGLMEAARSTRPGVFEYQLAAVANFVFLANGARGEGYRAIAASGPNIWFSHYFRNDCPLKDGDLVLFDYAPDYGYYTSDIGRMWPVNGRFGPLQRELYGFVVEYHKALLTRIRPGVLASQIMAEAAAEMSDAVARTRFSKPIYEAAARRLLEFKGHLSHPIGMAVHDVGSYQAEPLAPGLVITVDPQMWVPEEKLYIRVEDSVVVTDSGIENLTGFVPLELDETEALVGKRGILQAHSSIWL